MAKQGVRVSLLAALSAIPSASAAACWGAGGGFLRAEWSFCHRIKDDLLMYYGPSGADVKLGLYAEGFAGGWSALALGGNGGMKGASQVVVRQEGGRWVAEDRYSTGYTTPTMDARQDVTLLFAREESGSTAWGVRVPQSNCDPEDLPIRNISQWMHWALGQGHAFVYHGANRGQFHVNLIAGPPPVVDLAGALEVDIRMPSVPLAGNSTDSYICSTFDLEVLMPNRNASDKHHVVKFSPYLDPASRAYVHHIILLSCDSGATGFAHAQTLAPCERMPRGCIAMKWGWAVGSQDLVLPPGVGMPIGQGERWLAMQMHYYNPGLAPDVRDSSGVRIFVANTLRTTDAGHFALNGGIRSQQRPALQPGQPNIHIPSLLVPPRCTSAWSSDIHVVGVNYHGHLVAKRFNLAVSRGGARLGTLRHQPLYDFNHQSLEDSEVKTLKPGDELLFQCSYDTTSRSGPTEFGEQSQQEMCLSTFVYYPAQAMSAAIYVQPQAPRNGLDFFRRACATEAADASYRGVSECARLVSEDVLAVLDQARPGQRPVAALDLCNNGFRSPLGNRQYSKHEVAARNPALCPPCIATTCAQADIKAHAQAVMCPEVCENLGMSVWPDTSRTQPSVPSHATFCQGLGQQRRSPTVAVPEPDGGFCTAQPSAGATPSPSSPPPFNPISSAAKARVALDYGLMVALALRLAYGVVVALVLRLAK